MKNTINNKIDKGVALLNEALKQYESGNSSDAYKTYQAAGKYLTEANTALNSKSGETTMVYGDNRNFGIAYKVFESNTKNLLKNKEGQARLKKIMKLIKENAVLKSEFDIYNAFTNPTNVANAQEYVNEAVTLIKQIPVKELRENNEKLVSLFKECGLNENVEVTEDETELYEGIEYMILNKKSFKNINEYNTIQKKLCEHVTENNQIIAESVNLDTMYDDKVNEMVEKHSKELNEDEIKLIQDMNNPVKAKKLFHEYKTGVVTLVKEQISQGSDVEAWNSILEKVEKKTYEPKTALTDIAELIEIKNEIEDN